MSDSADLLSSLVEELGRERTASYTCAVCLEYSVYFFFNDTATTEIYTLSLHDALPIFVNSTEVGTQHRDPASPQGTHRALGQE